MSASMTTHRTALLNSWAFLLLLVFVACTGGGSTGKEAERAVNVYSHRHYDTDKALFDAFTEATGIAMKESPVGHEDFKTDILVRAVGNSLPDVFSYWAGARVQFIVDSDLDVYGDNRKSILFAEVVQRPSPKVLPAKIALCVNDVYDQAPSRQKAIDAINNFTDLTVLCIKKMGF